MKKGNLFVIFLLITIGVLIFLNFKTNPYPAKTLGTKDDDTFLGKEATDFNVIDITGKQFKLSQAKGKTVILFGFATWCSDCIEEAKTLSKIKHEYKNIEIIGVAFNQGETKESVERFQKLGSLDIPLALDTDKVSEKYKIINLSTTFIIDKTGKIVYFDEENTDEKKYQKELNSIL